VKVLVVNCGSSSIKYQFLNMEDESVLAKGLVERIGLEGAVLTHQPDDIRKIVINADIPDHKEGMKLVLDALIDPTHGVISDMAEIVIVGHRIVHGGEKLSKSVLVTPAVEEELTGCIDMAPLHTRAHLLGIKACEELMPEVPQVVVFDTAFHQTMPKEAYLYALPYEAYENYSIRKYGFHGTSHKYVSQRAAVLMERDISELKIITCHLGNGASMAAVKGGKCIDTSMGFTPLDGLVMGTRCGEIDPAIIPFLIRKEGFTADQIDTYLNKKSGILGISGISSDFRDIEEAAANGGERAQLALDMFAYRVRRFIGAYVAAMNGVDAIIFTAGLGENGIAMRERICKNMQYFGINVDSDRNNVCGKETEISAAGSKVKIFVIPTNEELVIARDTKEIYQELKSI